MFYKLACGFFFLHSPNELTQSGERRIKTQKVKPEPQSVDSSLPPLVFSFRDCYAKVEAKY